MGLLRLFSPRTPSPTVLTPPPYHRAASPCNTQPSAMGSPMELRVLQGRDHPPRPPPAMGQGWKCRRCPRSRRRKRLIVNNAEREKKKQTRKRPEKIAAVEASFYLRVSTGKTGSRIALLF